MKRDAPFRGEMFRALSLALPILALLLGAIPAASAAAPASKATAAATSPAVKAAPPLTATQIDTAIATLRDAKQRATLIATLEAMKGGATAATTQQGAPGIGLGIAQTIEEWAEQTLQGIGRALSDATDISLIWHWIEFVATDAWLRHTVLQATWRLAVVLAAALCAEWVVRRALRRPRTSLLRNAARRRAADGPGQEADGAEGIAAAEAGETERSRRRQPLRRWLRRVPWALGHFALELVPVIAFALAGVALVSGGIADDRVSRLVIGAALEAYVVSRFAMECARLLLNPRAPEIRLAGLGDDRARWLTTWLRAIVGTVAFGYAAIATGGLFGLYPAASRVLVKIVSLAVHLMLAVMILQARRPVAAFIRGETPSAGFTGALRIGLAHTWHILALFYVIALWVAWAIGVPHAFFIMLRIVVVLGLVAIIGRGVAASLASGLDSLFDERGTLRSRHPDLHARMRTYLPVLKLSTGCVIAALGLLVTLQLWGVSVFAWFAGTTLGRQIASAVVTIAAAILIALIVWEAANAALEAHAERLIRQGRPGRAARYRTLLPMLRSVLMGAILVVVALVVLGAVGVNITLLLGGLSIFGLAVGFGSQKLVQDIITGLFLLLEDAVQVGDWVTLAGISGSVEKLSIRTIRLRAGDGSLNVIPFSAVSTVSNFSREFSFAPITVGVAYKEDIDRVFAVIRDEFTKMRADPEWAPNILGDIELWGLDQFGASSLDIVGRMRTPAGQQHAVRREFNRRLKIRFDTEGIEIPFPYQRLTIDPEEFRAAFGSGTSGEARPPHETTPENG
ncbi:mechanosensitive ion channel [Acidiphilium multivorum]|uniref:mechanosensitive ion channel domain-containing protein n=1 Tax=Acidiphilium multivorum TaxID=62140 RepID=UPI001F4C33EA|nr:mechanosensitive ion channel domain-containing protein [Acidiphilium multivorum]UNC15260.1 mechanosensitive ion channel [Acidiphilium multivorum]